MNYQNLTFLIVFTFLLSCQHSTQEYNHASDLSLEAFKNPSVENRPLAFWDWLNGYIDTTKLVYELEQMKEKGMQGAFIWDVGALVDPDKLIPAGPGYLGDQSLEYIKVALENGDRLGLNLGMIASSSWNAGGTWIDKSDGSKELIISEQIVTGPSQKFIRVKEPKPQRGIPGMYSLVTSVAIPNLGVNQMIKDIDQVVPLDEFTSNDQVINWDVPDGQWVIVSFFMNATGQNLACPSPNSVGLMIDHLSQRATKIHFDTIFARLEKVSTSENQLKFLEVDSYEVWPATDWTPGFMEEFKARYGYDPKPYLPLLSGYHNQDSIIEQRFKGDYRRLVSDLMIENHFKQAREMVNEKGMLLFAEAGHGGFPRVDPLKAFGYTDVPMGEFWNRQRHWVTKEAASGAHIYGKNVVASESLTGWNHWQHGPADFKQLCDIAFCEGMNQLFFHTFAHNPEILGKPGAAYHAGEHINVNTTWWEMVKPFMDYLSRCSYMLRQGNFVGDVLLYYGDDAPNLVPPKRVDPNYTPDMPGVFPVWFNDHTKCAHCGRPKSIIPGDLRGYDYDYINADVITHNLEAKSGKMVLPNGASYRLMMLPDKPDISLEVLKRLENLVKDGAVIIGRKPERSTSLKNYPECDVEVKAIADKLWGDCDGKTVFSNQYGKGTIYWGKTLQEVLQELDVPPDFEVKGIDNSDWIIDHVHRQTASEDIYFISNSSEEPQRVICNFRVDKSRVPEIWDAETGMTHRAVEYQEIPHGISIDFILDPLASRFVVFKDDSTGKNDPDMGYNLQYGFENTIKDGNVTDKIDMYEDWLVHFDAEMGAPESYPFNQLISWTEGQNRGIQYFSGKATYKKNFNLENNQLSRESEAFVVFDEIQEIARVFVNGNDAGIIWTPPYQARITPYLRVGVNTITVEVINNWNNRIVGDLRNPDQEAFTKTNVNLKFSEKSPLLKSGLIGKAEILFLRN